MNNIALSCAGIEKTFTQRVIPMRHLQDRILHWYRFSETRNHKVLDGVSLNVRQGEWVGLYGPNGTGKTTLLRILAGMLPPDAGKVSYTGTLACFFDITAGFHPERTAAENVYLHGLLHGLSPQAILKRTDEIIGYADLHYDRDLPLKSYSTGMLMRLAFAALVHVDADIFLLDEIFAVGDESFQRTGKNTLRDLKKRGKSAIMVGHILQDLRQLCDRIIYMENGNIVREEIVASLEGRTSLQP